MEEPLLRREVFAIVALATDPQLLARVGVELVDAARKAVVETSHFLHDDARVRAGTTDVVCIVVQFDFQSDDDALAAGGPRASRSIGID